MQVTTCRMIGLRDLVLCCPCHLHWYHSPSKLMGLSWGGVGPGSSEHSYLPFKPDVSVGAYILPNPSLHRGCKCGRATFLTAVVKVSP